MMNAQAIIALVLISTLTACSMAIPVTKVTDAAPAEGEGTLLILPRTALTLNYTTVAKTFAAGQWTSEVDACAASDKDVKALEIRAILLGCNTAKQDADQCKEIFKDSRIFNSCIEIADLGLSSKRLSKPKEGKVCPSDGTDSEFRRSFALKTMAVTGAPVPDPDQVYWVETPARMFGDTQVAVSYTAAGTIAGAKSVSSNPFVAFGTEIAGIALKSFLGVAGGEGDGEKTAWTCMKVSGAECVALRADLKTLRSQIESEEKFLANISKDSPSSQVLLAAKQAQTAKTRAVFEGVVKTEEKADSVTWIPASADRLLPKVAESKECVKLDDPDKPVPNGSCIEQLVCAGEEDAKPPAYPLERLHFHARRAQAGAALATVITPTLDSTAVGDTHSRMKKRGFPYRAPIQSEANARVVRYSQKSAGEVESELVGSMPAARLAVAQFGEIGFLAPRAGGKSGTIEAKYFIDTGALETLSIQGVGADPAPILDPIKAALTPTPEADPMKAEKDRLETLKAICVAAAALNDPLPDFCKP